MHIQYGSPSHIPNWPVPAPSAYKDDSSVAARIEIASARIAQAGEAQKPVLPQHLWVQQASTPEEAAYRWLEGMVGVLKAHGAYNVAVENYQAVYGGVTRRDAEKLFAGELARAMFDPIPELFFAIPASLFDPRLNPAQAYRWDRVMHVLKDSGAYTAGIAYHQIYKVQRLAQFNRDWAAFLASRGMDAATIQRFIPERPQLTSWETANALFNEQLLRVGHPENVSRYLNDAVPPVPYPEGHYPDRRHLDGGYV